MNNTGDLLADNQFIMFATELYDHKIMHESDKTTIYKTTVVKKGLFKKEEIKEYDDKPYYDGLKHFIKTTLKEDTDEPISFRAIWEFCQFVRWAEKALFYENELSNRVIVDSGMNAGIADDNARIIVFQSNSTSTTIKLELKKVKIDIPNSVFNLGPVEDYRTTKDVISLEVIRSFGKKMKSKYTIVDGEVGYNDISDIYLMNTVNKIVKDGIINVFREILLSIETGVMFKDFNTETDKDIKQMISSHFS